MKRYELNYLNVFERFMLHRILKKTVKQGGHVLKMKNLLFELTIHARIEFCEDEEETFYHLMKDVYKDQLKYIKTN